MEKYYRLITRDGIMHDLQRLHDYRPEIQTIEKPKYSAIAFESGNIDSDIKTRTYRFRRVIQAEIYVYEEN